MIRDDWSAPFGNFDELSDLSDLPEVPRPQSTQQDEDATNYTSGRRRPAARFWVGFWRLRHDEAPLGLPQSCRAGSCGRSRSHTRPLLTTKRRCRRTRTLGKDAGCAGDRSFESDTPVVIEPAWRGFLSL